MASKLQRSNAAHKRLMRKHSQLGGVDARIKEDYHGSVEIMQGIRRRLLSKKEKKEIYHRSVKSIKGIW